MNRRVSVIWSHTKRCAAQTAARPHGVVSSFLCVVAALLCAAPFALAGQRLPGKGDQAGREASAAWPDAPRPQAASAQDSAIAPAGIHGVVVDKDGGVYEGAHIALALATDADGAPAAGGQSVRETITDSNGRFAFTDVPAGVYKVTVSSIGFATQVVTGTLHAGESLELKEVVLLMGSTTSEVQVTASREEITQAELKEEETQRVLAVIPNFYVSYIPHPSPLSKRQKFSLAWRLSIDPITFISVGIFAGIEQENNSYSGFGQGAQGYAKRFGATYTDGFTGAMIGSALLPAWWKQDPRYFYKGTGTIRARALYAIGRSVLCNGDNGRTQVNYSGIIGGLASAGISNIYYPAANRNGAGLTFENALIGTGEGALQNLFQEFVVRKLTPHVPKYGSGN